MKSTALATDICLAKGASGEFAVQISPSGADLEAALVGVVDDMVSAVRAMRTSAARAAATVFP